MRGALAVLLALSLLGAAGLMCAHRAVAATAETVELRETVLCGDADAARGIKARVPLYCAGRLFWDTEMETDGGTPVTEFRYSAAREYIRGVPWYDGLSVRVMTNMGAGGNFGKDFDFEDLYDDYVDGYYAVYGDLLRDVASRTAPGERHHEYVELTDWLDCLPLQFDFSLPGFVYVYDNGEDFIETNRGFTAPLGRVLAEYFRIPLPGTPMVNVSISRNTDGEIVEWNITSGLDEDDVEPGGSYGGRWEALDANVGCLSAVTDDACYFVFDEWPWERGSGYVDFSALPGGRGVYRLPVEYDGEDTTRLFLDEIEAVLPVADGEAVELLDSDGERLLLFTVRDGKLYLTQAPLSDLADVRKTELTELAVLEYGNDGCNRVVRAEGLFYLETKGGRVLLLESVDGGAYELVLNVPRELSGAEVSVDAMLTAMSLRQSYAGSDYTLLWDGERLAVACWCEKYYNRDGTVGFVLRVYGGAGLLYCGLYESSLSRAPTEMYDNCVFSAGKLELDWR